MAAGLHLAARAKLPVDVEAFVQKARRADIGVESVRDYQWGRPARAGVVFGYGAIDEKGIQQGLERLRHVRVS
jgi:GntR family transcriptional regulator/MocR family aminotransferase